MCNEEGATELDGRPERGREWERAGKAPADWVGRWKELVSWTGELMSWTDG